MTIKLGDNILFKGSNKIAAKLIKFFRQSEYYHCGVVVEIYECKDKSIVVTVCESTLLKGVHLSEYILNNTKHSVYQVSDLTDEDRTTIVKSVVSQIGKKYDYKAILYLCYLTITFQLRKKNKWNNDDSHFCQEINALGYESVNIDLREDMPDSNTSPGDIALSKLTIKVY